MFYIETKAGQADILGSTEVYDKVTEAWTTIGTDTDFVYKHRLFTAIALHDIIYTFGNSYPMQFHRIKNIFRKQTFLIGRSLYFFSYAPWPRVPVNKYYGVNKYYE